MGHERLQVLLDHAVAPQPALDELRAERAALVGGLAVVVGEGDRDELGLELVGATGAAMFCVMPRAEPPQVPILPLHQGCLRDPLQRVAAVLVLAQPVVAEDDGGVPFGLEPAAQVLDHERVPAPRRVRRHGAAALALVVGRAGDDDRILARAVAGQVDVRGQLDAVAHGDHVRRGLRSRLVLAGADVGDRREGQDRQAPHFLGRRHSAGKTHGGCHPGITTCQPRSFDSAGRRRSRARRSAALFSGRTPTRMSSAPEIKAPWR